MAQLPPKVPTFTPTTAAAAAAWVDEFLDFSAVRRGAHRRSASGDAIAFLEASEADDFDRLDDDQLLSMFCDQVAPLPPAEEEPLSSAGNASTPSDNNSVNEEKVFVDRRMRGECEEAQSQCGGGPPAGAAAEADSQFLPAAAAAATEQVMDTKRVKRILANRQSAQRSRVRKLQYISELERSVTALQTEVSALSPRVAFFDHQRSVLSVGNSHLKQRIAALAQDKIFKDGKCLINPNQIR
ncbi:Transcription factor VIP1 [Platanthera zijinensis]|uniref:Transcription factor VIP1 n=1 Tax=Platanthera zijinensis TaxID=2320716 RepID=A0AAP0BIK0_9ASPA